MTADLLITGARLWSGRRRSGADAVAIRGERIAGIGSAHELAALRGRATRVIDAGGATVTPGLCDAHIHLLDWARARTELEVSPADSVAAIVAKVVRAASSRPGRDPIVGRGWDANSWSGAPERASLDAGVADRPVLLYSRDFHNLWVNGAALAAAGIGPDTPDPEGGTVVRDAAGQPTGLLREHAMRLVAGLVAPDERADLERLRDTCRALHAFGVTAVHDFEGAAAHRLLRRLAGTEAGVRTLMHLPHAQLDHAIGLGLASGLGTPWFRIGAVKLFADGTLGSRTAAMLEPYEGTTGRGEELLSPARLRDEVGRAVTAGWSVAIHAIGDRAVRNALDAFEAVAPKLATLALPPRIEHAQLVDPADLPRFARLGVAASMQPTHCVSDIPLAERGWGARCDHAYPWQALLSSGATLAFGSDAPVEPPDPSLGLFAAVARRRPGGPPWVPAQRIDLDAALHAYTEGAARISGAWPDLGALTPGAFADLVVWDTDLHAASEDDLARARPVATVLAGSVVYAHAAGGDVPANAGAAADPEPRSHHA